MVAMDGQQGRDDHCTCPRPAGKSDGGRGRRGADWRREGDNAGQQARVQGRQAEREARQEEAAGAKAKGGDAHSRKGRLDRRRPKGEYCAVCPLRPRTPRRRWTCHLSTGTSCLTTLRGTSSPPTLPTRSPGRPRSSGPPTSCLAERSSYTTELSSAGTSRGPSESQRQRYRALERQLPQQRYRSQREWKG